MSSHDDTPERGIQINGSDHGVPLMMIAERLARIETTLEGIRRDRDEMVKWIETGREDHEKRLRALERWRYMLPSSLIAGAASVGLSVWSQLGK